MSDLSAHMRTIIRVILFSMLAGLLIWGVVPSIRPITAGFILGSAVSLINSYYLGQKIEKLTKLVVENKGKRAYLGFATRVCMCLLAVMVALKNPQFELASTIVGLFYAQLVILSMGFWSVIRINR